MHTNPLETLLKCRYWCSGSGVRHEIPNMETNPEVILILLVLGPPFQEQNCPTSKKQLPTFIPSLLHLAVGSVFVCPSISSAAPQPLGLLLPTCGSCLLCAGEKSSCSFPSSSSSRGCRDWEKCVYSGPFFPLSPLFHVFYSVLSPSCLLPSSPTCSHSSGLMFPLWPSLSYSLSSLFHPLQSILSPFSPLLSLTFSSFPFLLCPLSHF